MQATPSRVGKFQTCLFHPWLDMGLLRGSGSVTMVLVYSLSHCVLIESFFHCGHLYHFVHLVDLDRTGEVTRFCRLDKKVIIPGLEGG